MSDDRIYAVYTDGRRPVCIKQRVTLEYAQWWCSTRNGYFYAKY